jgi:hypothetical protein
VASIVSCGTVGQSNIRRPKEHKQKQHSKARGHNKSAGMVLSFWAHTCFMGNSAWKTTGKSRAEAGVRPNMKAKEIIGWWMRQFWILT